MDSKEWKEADMTINGQKLSVGQSLTIRIAIESLAMMLHSGLGEDEHGRAMTENYYKRIEEIRKLIRIKG
jgi:hypothetical protein